jgi:hypothetical protein
VVADEAVSLILLESLAISKLDCSQPEDVIDFLVVMVEPVDPHAPRVPQDEVHTVARQAYLLDPTQVKTSTAI